MDAAALKATEAALEWAAPAVRAARVVALGVGERGGVAVAAASEATEAAAEEGAGELASIRRGAATRRGTFRPSGHTR